MEVLGLLPACERSVNMLNMPLFYAVFDILPLLSKMVCLYKLYDHSGSRRGYSMLLFFDICQKNFTFIIVIKNQKE